MRIRGWALGLCLSGSLASLAWAQSVQEVESALQAQSRQAALSQDEIDQLDDATRQALLKYRAALLRAEQLRLYQKQLQAQAQTQQQRLAELEQALERVEATKADMVPVLVRMAEALEEFVAADQPFQRDQREARVAGVRDLLADPDAALAEQYRGVYAAWQAEADLGRQLGAERVNLPGAAAGQLVDLVAVGRLALYALSLDGSMAWQWQAQRKRFTPLPQAAVPSLQKALRVAQEQAAPSLLTLPEGLTL
nr:DUF3450 domain-containing protein [Oceanococcus sp. HetDA_MAG_MS8]